MTLISGTEFKEFLAPLLAEEAADADEAFALVALSKLCEPGDGMAGQLLQALSAHEIIQCLVDRASADEMAARLGADCIEHLESSYEQPWPRLWQAATERWLPRLNRNELLAALRWFSGVNLPGKAQLVLRDSGYFPVSFEDLGVHRPHALWCLGDITLLGGEHLVSIVGSRQVSRYGTEVTRDLAAVAAQAAVTTVSGGAYGVDAIVHESALALSAPTIAIMAGGLNHLYPKGNLAMLHSVAGSGLVFTESVPDVTPAKFRFLQRNRLIAALGRATVIVEAGATSGALSTGTRAVALNREVAVVPGPIGSAYSVGCHDFLNNNLGQVHLLARPQQLLELAGLGFDLSLQADSLGRLEKRALDAIGHLPMQAWQVQRLSGLTVKELQIALGSLEILGLVERVGTSYARV